MFAFLLMRPPTWGGTTGLFNTDLIKGVLKMRFSINEQIIVKLVTSEVNYDLEYEGNNVPWRQ